MTLPVAPAIWLTCLSCNFALLLTDVAIEIAHLIAPGTPPHSIDVAMIVDAETAAEIGSDLSERHSLQTPGYWRLECVPSMLSLRMKGRLTQLDIDYFPPGVYDRARIRMHIDETT